MKVLRILLAAACGLAALPTVLAQAPTADGGVTDDGDRAGGSHFRIGVVPVEPLVIDEGQGIYDGLGVSLWETVAQQGGYTYEYVDVDKDSIRPRLRRGELDLWLAATPRTGSRDTTEHSPIYFTSSMAVAKRGSSSVVNVVTGLLSPAFFKTVAGLSVLLLIIGTIIHLVERKANEEQFGGKIAEGIGAGFWWAGVTLTTIGYGDKAPVTLAGRAVAMLWMLVGLAVSATLTATIVALATKGSAALNLPGDLTGARNVAVEHSNVEPFLERLGIAYATVADVPAGIEAVEDERADFLVAPRMELEHYLNENSSSLDVQVSRLVPSYYAIGFRPGLPQADTISALVADVTGSGVWSKWLDQYVPKG